MATWSAMNFLGFATGALVNSGGSFVPLTLALNGISVGSLIVVRVIDQTTSLGSISDNQGNSYIPMVSFQGYQNSLMVWLAKCGVPPTSMTYNYTGNVSQWAGKSPGGILLANSFTISGGGFSADSAVTAESTSVPLSSGPSTLVDELFIAAASTTNFESMDTSWTEASQGNDDNFVNVTGNSVDNEQVTIYLIGDHLVGASPGSVTYNPTIIADNLVAITGARILGIGQSAQPLIIA
jgi:hypothetical protein